MLRMLSIKPDTSPYGKFVYEFSQRHEFVSDDIQILRNKFPSVAIKQIPLAWVIVIDEFLADAQKRWPGAVISATQVGGFFTCQVKPEFKNDDDLDELIQKTSSRLRDIDIDIHEELERRLDVRRP